MAKHRREKSEKGFFLIGIAVRSGRRDKVLSQIKNVLQEYARRRLHDDEMAEMLGKIVLRVIQEKEDIYFELNQSDVGLWDVIKIVRELRRIKGVLRTSIKPLVFKDLSTFRGKHLAYGQLEVKAGDDERVMSQLKMVNIKLDENKGQILDAGYCFSHSKSDIIVYMSSNKLAYFETLMDTIRECSGIIDTEFYIFRKYKNIIERKEGTRQIHEGKADENNEKSLNGASNVSDNVSDYKRLCGL